MKTNTGTTQYRIDFACKVILSGRSPQRSFDNCFENDDCDKVAAGVYKRALKNPKIMESMPRYLGIESCKKSYLQELT